MEKNLIASSFPPNRADHHQLFQVMVVHNNNMNNFMINSGRQPMMITNSSCFTKLEIHVKKMVKTLMKVNDQPAAPLLLIEKPSSPQSIQQRPSMASMMFNKFEGFIRASLDSPLRPGIDPKHVLSENFAPVVGELPPTACKVVGGPLPSCLHGGAYIRNGPNPQFTPDGPYHLFDGDGMLHVVRFCGSGGGGEPTFCSRYVQTHKHTVEREMGHPVVPSPFSSANGLPATVARLLLTAARVLAGHFDPAGHGFGSANTSVALFPCGGLFALSECDLPYAVELTGDGDVVTLGRPRRGFLDGVSFFTAHPKFDRRTGETFAFSYDMKPPFLRFFRADSEGRKRGDVGIGSVGGITMIHDFAVTDRYAVFPSTQIGVSMWRMLRGGALVGVDEGKVPGVGVIPRYAEDDSEMWWADAPGLNMIHCVNAWEEGGGSVIVVVASNALRVEEVFESIGLARLRLEKITIDVKAKTVERRPLSDQDLEFGQINPAYAAKKNRYVYAAVIGLKALVGVVKLDLSLADEDCTVASHLYGPGCYGSEPYFVAREPNNPTAEEDDGYLLSYVHNENNGESELLVMDAKSATLEIVAAVKLPRRVPNGFHGLFLSGSDINKL